VRISLRRLVDRDLLDPRRASVTRMPPCFVLWWQGQKRARDMETPRIRGNAADGQGAVLDAATLDAFVRAHHQRLTSLARLVCLDAQDAADAIQAAFEQAWRRRSSLQDIGAIRPWLDRIVVREAIRQDRRRRSPLARFFGGPREVPLGYVDRHAEHALAMSELRIAYEALPADQRAAIALHLHLGYSVAETAEIVGAPIETVRSRLRLGRERLRRQLEEAS
jgi:RNA polymerase sigma-70 factor (ECF subfamily)